MKVEGIPCQQVEYGHSCAELLGDLSRPPKHFEILITLIIACCTHPKRANLGKWMERAMMSSRMLNKFTTKHSSTASSLCWFMMGLKWFHMIE